MPRTLEQIMEAAAQSAYYQDGTARWLRIDTVDGTDLHLHDEDTHEEFVVDLRELVTEDPIFYCLTPYQFPDESHQGPVTVGRLISQLSQLPSHLPVMVNNEGLGTLHESIDHVFEIADDPENGDTAAAVIVVNGS